MERASGVAAAAAAPCLAGMSFSRLPAGRHTLLASRCFIARRLPACLPGRWPHRQPPPACPTHWMSVQRGRSVVQESFSIWSGLRSAAGCEESSLLDARLVGQIDELLVTLPVLRLAKARLAGQHAGRSGGDRRRARLRTVSEETRGIIEAKTKDVACCMPRRRCTPELLRLHRAALPRSESECAPALDEIANTTMCL
ncbi:hypothetical protein IWZ00DRAFT_334434 [Phyllosticta capitalensis]|uniref:Uncharacterized protein n=1 Tax=Phyllosticta capitalensis TaxID=121624 RepID=A0ABR1YH44_9PEZI